MTNQSERVITVFSSSSLRDSTKTFKGLAYHHPHHITLCVGHPGHISPAALGVRHSTESKDGNGTSMYQSGPVR